MEWSQLLFSHQTKGADQTQRPMTHDVRILIIRVGQCKYGSPSVFVIIATLSLSARERKRDAELTALFFLVLYNGVHACPTGWSPSQVDANTCYSISQQPMTWADAENFCVSNGGPGAHLTSILSAFETNVITGLASQNPAIGANDQVWIGAHGQNNDATFVWQDGSPFSYTNWLAGQPNKNFPCVSTLAKSGGRWSTGACETKNHFICKYSAQPSATPTDCYDLHFKNGISANGIYQIHPPGIAPFNVYCDMVTEGGGWTVFQKRTDKNTIFWNRIWTDYKNGFSDTLDKNSWLGLDKISLLSKKDQNVLLRIDTFGNRCNTTGAPLYCASADPNMYHYGVWEMFNVENEAKKYRLTISPIMDGNITITNDNYGLYTFNNNQSFTTVDQNNQQNQAIGNCASSGNFELGAWWHGDCGQFHLNGKYDFDGRSEKLGFFGFGFLRGGLTYFDSYWVNPIGSEIKLRRKA